ncbi:MULTISPECIES: SGNH/GDSL hydrolase family protein [Roseivirga]|nr:MULTISPECIES: SGNH/GDSL hydrolase family protein [Roseivirga]
MKRLKIYLLAMLPLAFVTFSCDEEDAILEQQLKDNPLPEAPSGDPGVLDFSQYVAIGNSLAAGVMDGALYTDGQNHSIPALLAAQFQISGVGGGSFNQPDINSVNGYSGPGPDGQPGTSDDQGRFLLSLALAKPVPTPGELPTAYGGNKAELNNFGVPGMRITEVLSPSLANNPYYARFASAPGTSTVLGDALATSPTFFTYWLGSNDILQYAIGGGSNESLITSAQDFQDALSQSLGALVQSGAEGVVLTLPPYVLLPYFRAVPYNAIPMTDANVVAQLNAAFSGLNRALDGLVQVSQQSPLVNVSQQEADRRKVSYALGANPILIKDDALVDFDRPGGEFDILLALQLITPAERQALAPYGQSRPATANDLPTLASASVLGTAVGGNAQALVGITVPAADNLILSASEVQTVVGTRAQFNAIIAGVVAGINAQSNGSITLVDVQPAFADLFGLSPAAARFLIDPSQGTNQALEAMGEAAAAQADGQLGLEVDGHNLRPDFAPNGVFSTDGVHPNPRGNAIIANLIIDALNTTRGANIPHVNVIALRGIVATDL